MNLKVRIDARRATAEFASARKQVNRNVREGLAKAVERVAAPRVRRYAPSIVRPIFVGKATGTRGYITTRGSKKLDRIAGLLNWGGTVSGSIYPKSKKALSTPQGPRAATHKPRRYRGKHFVERGVESSRPQFEEIMLDSVMEAFDGLPQR